MVLIILYKIKRQFQLFNFTLKLYNHFNTDTIARYLIGKITIFIDNKITFKLVLQYNIN